MEELIPMNVVIGDRSYRVKLTPQDEEVVRKTLKIINDRIIEFKTQFSGKDMQDYLAMVVLWYATQQAAGNNLPVQDELSRELEKLELLVDKALTQ